MQKVNTKGDKRSNIDLDHLDDQRFRSPKIGYSPVTINITSLRRSSTTVKTTQLVKQVFFCIKIIHSIQIQFYFKTPKLN